MKVSSSPFEAPTAARTLDAGERAEIDGIKIDDTPISPVEPPPAPIAEIRPELDAATRESLRRLSDLIRSQKRESEPEQEVAPEPEVKAGPSAILTIGSIAVSQANRRIREAQRIRGRDLYRSLARQQALTEVESALAGQVGPVEGDSGQSESVFDFIDEVLEGAPAEKQEPGIATDSQGNIAAGFMIKRVA